MISKASPPRGSAPGAATPVLAAKPPGATRAAGRPRHRVAGLVLVLLALLGSAVWHPSAAEAATLDERRAELDQARSRLGEIQGELDALAREYVQSEARLYEIDDAIGEAEADQAKTSSDMAALQARLAERLVEVYKTRQSATPVYLEALFQEGDFLDVIMRAAMLNRVAADDGRFFTEVVDHLRRSQSLEQELAAKRTEQAAEVDRLAEAERTMQSRLEEVSDEYSRLQRVVAKLEEEQRRAAEAARAAAAAAAAKGTTGGSSGGNRSGGGSSTAAVSRAPSGFVFPVAGPHSYINDWGYARSGGRSHQGTDIMAPRGTPVVACVSGTVSRTTYNSGLGGTTVWLRGSDGASYYYAHLDGIAAGIGSGTSVAAGRVLGYVGNSGNARGGATHLHFEIRRGGAINPYPILRTAG